MSLETLKPKVAELIEKAKNGGGTDDLSKGLLEKSIQHFNYNGTKIGSYIFRENKVLETVNAPNVTELGDDAFMHCNFCTS